MLMEGVIRAKLIDRISRTPTVESFRFLPEVKINFLPGQFTRLFFDADNKNNASLNKYLSFSCAPQRDYIEVTKRLSESEFSQRLKRLQKGDEIVLSRPLGNCIFKESYKKIVFLTGGIGITPAISIIEYIVEKKIDTDVVLLYANRNEEEIAFRLELDGWQNNFKKLKICYTVSCKSSPDSVCREGNIDAIFCRGNLVDLCERKVFIYGPPVMVAAMQDLVLQLDCKKENVLIENFTGY
jgi:glycine betaine catabolism B